MGSIHVDSIYKRSHQESPSVKSHTDRNAFRTFDVADLAPGQVTTSTGMKVEIILLSWLLLLLRNQEDSQVSFEWAYRDATHDPHNEPRVRCLSMNEVIPTLQCKIRQVAAAISHHIKDVAPDKDGTTATSSLFLSTNHLSQTSNAATMEVSGCSTIIKKSLTLLSKGWTSHRITLWS
jgi:hypothetical protein